MAADAAALVVVVHHPLAEPGLALVYLGAEGGDDAGGLVAGDHWLVAALDAAADDAGHEGLPVALEIGAAHARGLDLQDDVARARHRIGEFAQLGPPLAEKNHALHGDLLLPAWPLTGPTRSWSAAGSGCSPRRRWRRPSRSRRASSAIPDRRRRRSTSAPARPAIPRPRGNRGPGSIHRSGWFRSRPGGCRGVPRASA